jgi:uncharacterized protein (DUF427 family)
MRRVKPKKGQESVWDYPRPPRLERTSRRIRVEFDGELIADTTRALRLLETSHPPVYYIPPEDVRTEMLEESRHRSYCEFKGAASYWSIRSGERVSPDAAWSYANAQRDFRELQDHFAFYASRVDACYVDDEKVQAQEGDFYGGWITSEIVGPIKGGAGTFGW